MFRSINLLIGILILLFVLTTLGFSGIAYANTGHAMPGCGLLFVDYEYQREETEFDIYDSDASFIGSPRSHFYEKDGLNEYFESTDDFAPPPSQEFGRNNSF